MEEFVILFAAIGVFISLYFINKKTNFYWILVAKHKWRELKPQVDIIMEINNRTLGDGKKIGFIDKNISKKSKKRFHASKEAYVQYIEFCNSKNVFITDEQKELEAIIDKTENALLNPSEALDKELELANKQYDEIYEVVNSIGEALFEERKAVAEFIDEIQEFINSISKHPKLFDKDFKEIKLHREQFKQAIDYAKEQSKALKKSAKGAGVGVVTGVATASMAPTAAMWVATTFGTASTGTAISALSGAAATNAALAWLGGGALTAGGGGVVAGQALLALAGPIGWGIAGTSLLASVILYCKNKLNLLEKKRDEIVMMKKCTEALKEVKAQMEAVSIKIDGIKTNMIPDFNVLKKLENGDYKSFSNEEKSDLARLVNNTKSLSRLLGEVIK